MSPLTHFSRFSLTAATATRNRVAHITRRNYVTEAVPEDFVAKRKAIEEHAKSTAKLWMIISFTICPVALIGSTISSYMIMKQHEAHAHEHSHEIDHPHFSYMKMRAKPFFWGNGDHTLFHNPAVNGP